MRAGTYLRERQFLWAKRKGIEVGGQFRHSPDPTEASRGAKAFTYELGDNLFEPLSEEPRRGFEDGDGETISESRIQNEPMTR